MKRWLQRLFHGLERGRRFATHDVWHLGRPGEELPHSFVIKQVRVAILLVHGLVKDTLLLRASALTFATLLGIVPFLAIFFYVMQAFKVDEKVYDAIYERVSEMRMSAKTPATPGDLSTDTSRPVGGIVDTETQAEHKDFIRELMDLVFRQLAARETAEDGTGLTNPIEEIVKYAQEGADSLAGRSATALVFVIVTVFGLMMNIESSFNTIWGLKRTRGWLRILSDYLMVILLLPFLVALVLSAKVVLEVTLKEELPSSLAFTLNGLQYGIIWLAFSAIYYVVPNTRVRTRYALLGGVVAGTLWVFASALYFHFAFNSPQYSMLYKTFAQIPILLMWLFVSWVILLFGAELTFAYQNETTFAMERFAEGASFAYREALGLWAMLVMARQFDESGAGLSPMAFAQEWKVPTRTLNEVLAVLEDTGLVTQRAGEEIVYQPGRSVTKITLGEVVSALREAGREPSPLRQEAAFRPLLERLSGLAETPMATTLSEALPELRPVPSAPPARCLAPVEPVSED